MKRDFELRLTNATSLATAMFVISLLTNEVGNDESYGIINTTPPGAADLKEIEAAARVLGVRVLPLKLQGSDELASAFRAAVKGRVDALIIAAHGFIHSHREKIVSLTAKNRLPAMYTNPEFVTAGGLMSYAADIPDQYRRAANYVDKILKGSKPAELPVQQPMKFELVINLKAAKQIGLAISPNVLGRADRVIR